MRIAIAYLGSNLASSISTAIISSGVPRGIQKSGDWGIRVPSPIHGSVRPIPVPYPPLDEQRLIVRFLDWHGGRTLRLIRARKKLVALLNEQKQAIVHRAVTCGLDPKVKLKPSGIPWLGDVPE